MRLAVGRDLEDASIQVLELETRWQQQLQLVPYRVYSGAMWEANLRRGEGRKEEEGRRKTERRSNKWDKEGRCIGFICSYFDFRHGGPLSRA